MELVTILGYIQANTMKIGKAKMLYTEDNRAFFEGSSIELRKIK
jgi:hypothetical protein